MVVGGVALVATGVGAAAGAGLFGAAATMSAGTAAFISTAATVAKVAGFAAAALMATSSLTAPKASAGGSPDQWKADPDAGIDIVFGDTYNGGHIIYRTAYGDKNKYQTLVTEWSIGPVQSLDTLYIDQIARAVVGGAVTVPNQGFIHEARQRGLCPEPAALTVAPAQPYGWTAAHKLSGKAATIMTFEYDTKGKNTQTSIPTCGWRGKGVLCYDPRLDSTYPGGAGPQRAGDQTTWAWSNNPYVVGLTWCLGWKQNGKLVAGVGLPVTGILVDQFVEAANVATAMGWTVGGVKSTTDDKWDVLKDILQAGAGEPLRLGALLGCIVQRPRVSLATIDRNSLAQGDITIAAMQARRDRMNTVVPRYWAEEKSTDPSSGITTTTWAEVPAAPIVVADYVAADGRQVRKELPYPLVQCFAGQQPTQAAQLARYDLENSREFGPITLPLKIRWMGYKPGDVVTLDIPEAGLEGQDVMLLTRSLEASTGVVTVTARSETAAKHAFALGQTAVPPTSPSLPSNAWLLEVPGLTSLEDAALQLAVSASFPIGLTITAAADGSIVISNHTRRYNDGHADVAVTGTTIQSGLAAGSFRAIGYDDEDRVGGAVTYLLEENDIDARSSPDAPGRHYLGYATIPTAGSPPSSGGGAVPPGGYCVTVDTPLLLAVGAEKPAGDFIVGDRLLTRHEERLDAVNGGWGSYPVEAIEIVDSDDVWEATVGGKLLRATGDHLVYTGTWVAMRDLGAKIDGTYQVAKITVTGAHTYVSNGILSHNIKQNQSLE